jgi:hypothetical protein
MEAGNDVTAKKQKLQFQSQLVFLGNYRAAKTVKNCFAGFCCEGVCIGIKNTNRIAIRIKCVMHNGD